MRDAERELHHFRLRVAIASGFVLVMFGLLFVRFVYLQVVMHDHYHTLAEANRISILPIMPSRGIIVDRNGVVLAHNYSAYTLEMTPSKVDDVEATIDELATLVEITPRDRRRFKKLLEESKRFESLPVRTRLTDEEIARFAANRYRFPGVDVRARLFRQYPQGELFSHVIGHIGRINQKDLDKLEEEGTELELPRHRLHGQNRPREKLRGRSCMARPASSRSRSIPAGAPCARSRALRRFPAATSC